MNKDILKFRIKYELKDNGDTSQNLFVKTYQGPSLISKIDLGNIFDIIVNKKENTNLKQALNEIREYINKNREEYSNYVGSKKEWLYIKDKDILQIIDKLGDEK